VKYHLLFLLSYIFSFGIQSFQLPHNAYELSCSNSGIGNTNNININFSGINNFKNHWSFSSIQWYQGVKGNNIEYKWGKKSHHYINLYNLYAKDIELRDIIPTENPIGFFDIQHISFSYGYGASIFEKLNYGIQTNLSYNQLYVDESFGYHLDFGFSYMYNEVLSIGFSAQQIGFEKHNNLTKKYPILVGIGSTLKLHKINTNFNSDIIYDNQLLNPLSLKISTVSNYKAISLISGYHFNESKKEFSCGFSFKYRKLQFDYGIALNTILGNPTILSIKYKI